MLYVKNVDLGGRIVFSPIRDNNIYLLCERCGRMVPINDPAGFFYELGAVSSFDRVNTCDDCYDELCEEEEKLKEEHPELFTK